MGARAQAVRWGAHHARCNKSKSVLHRIKSFSVGRRPRRGARREGARARRQYERAARGERTSDKRAVPPAVRSVSSAVSVVYRGARCGALELRHPWRHAAGARAAAPRAALTRCAARAPRGGSRCCSPSPSPACCAYVCRFFFSLYLRCEPCVRVTVVSPTLSV